MNSGSPDFLESVIELARKEGADDVEAIYQEGQSMSVGCRNGELEKVQSADSSGLSIRVFVGRRPASASTSDLNPDAVLALVQRAVSVAKVSPEDPYADLTPADELARKPEIDLQTFDASVIAAEDLQQMALTAEAEAVSVEGVVRSRGAGASCSKSKIRYATSNGFNGEHSGSAFSIGCGAIAGSEGSRETEGEVANAVYLADLDDPATVGRTAGARAAARVGSERMKTGRVSVVFDPRIANSLLGHLASAISGAAIATGSSFLKGMLGEQVFAKGIDIIDDPLRIRGSKTHWFDGEGVATRRMALVEDGVLRTWLLDRATAKQLKMKTNGQANRSGAGTSPGPSNLFLGTGSCSPSELISDIRYGLYVTGVMGQGVNGNTGGYSRGATGFLIENGEITMPVKEVTIAGNLIDMFRNLAPANNLEFRNGIDAPTVRIDSMSLAGK